MKKVLKAELHNLAIQILKLDSTEDLSKLKKIAGDVYDKLNILEFAEQHFEGTEPTVEKQDIIEALENSENFRIEPMVEIIKEETTEKVEEVREKAQPEIEKISTPEKLETKQDLSPEEQEYNERQRKLEALEAKTYMKNDMAHIGGVSYDDLPEFEPVPTPEQPEKPKKDPEIVSETQAKTKNNPSKPTKKSLNDLNRGIKIGLNDRLAFIKHLFDGSAGDYNRVLSQLNTHSNFENANNFLETVVKPDYNDWDGKDLYAERFREVIEKRFSK